MLKRNAAILIIAAVVVGFGTFAWAQGAPERPAQTTAAPGDRAGNRRGHPGAAPLRRAVHGDLIVKAKDGNGFENVTFDRGEVTAVSGTSITLKRRDGQSVTKSIDANTKFRGVESAAKVQTGKPAVVASKDGKATVVGQRDPAKAPANRANPDNRAGT